MTTHCAPDASYKFENFTGRDLIGYLIKSNHLGEVKSFYLNFETIDDYKPYNLVTVPKAMVSYRVTNVNHNIHRFIYKKANPEHFIFSVFGVLHIIPNEECENLTLAEWNRHAVLWNACTKIKFFKEFLFRKFFSR